mmetsp:Transcript_3460/g.5002  ORF Transcript_3460/g.5002 Transcript_3460/m.5002 type:complete len:88 (-) Transcript_3460:1227-1490(-)
MDLCTKWLGEDVRCVVLARNVLDEDNAILDQLSDPMIPARNVTGSRTVAWVITDSDSGLIVLVENCRTLFETQIVEDLAQVHDFLAC